MTALERLQQWAKFGEADGFRVLHFTDSGVITVHCDREISVAHGFNGCTHDGVCACQTFGWVVEFRAGMIAEGSTYPGEHGEHVWAVGLTLDDACRNLVAQIQLRAVCPCREEES